MWPRKDQKCKLHCTLCKQKCKVFSSLGEAGCSSTQLTILALDVWKSLVLDLSLSPVFTSCILTRSSVYMYLPEIQVLPRGVQVADHKEQALQYLLAPAKKKNKDLMLKRNITKKCRRSTDGNKLKRVLRVFNSFWSRSCVYLSRSCKAWRALLSRGVWGHAPPGNFEFLDSWRRIFPHFETQN